MSRETPARAGVPRLAALRGPVAPARPTRLERFESRLRVVGVMLETQPAEVYEIIVGPHLIEVEADDGYCHVFTAEEVAALIDEAAARRAPDA